MQLQVEFLGCEQRASNPREYNHPGGDSISDFQTYPHSSEDFLKCPYYINSRVTIYIYIYRLCVCACVYIIYIYIYRSLSLSLSPSLSLNSLRPRYQRTCTPCWLLTPRCPGVVGVTTRPLTSAFSKSSAVSTYIAISQKQKFGWYFHHGFLQETLSLSLRQLPHIIPIFQRIPIMIPSTV